MPTNSSNSQQPNNALPSYTPPGLANAVPMTRPQGAPGQLEGLARDMALGGYGGGKNASANWLPNYGWLDNMFDPVTSLRLLQATRQLTPTGPTTPKTPTIPTTPTTPPSKTPDRPRTGISGGRNSR